MTKSFVLLALFVPALAFAQPGSAGSASDAGSAAPVAAPAPPAPDLRKVCADAMNADPSFEKKIVEIADKKAAEERLRLDLEQHEKAAAAIVKNEKHVIMAYAAMWIVAAAFLMFLWRRQQLLRGEIAQLKADLDAATKDTK